jgi:hypothetical protein
MNVETAVLKAEWGYGTNKDGLRWKAEICETCADEFKDWVNQGTGPGMLVEEYLRSEYETEGMLERINYAANEDLGLSGEEFLKRLEDGDEFADYPDEALSRPYLLARAYLHQQKSNLES